MKTSLIFTSLLLVTAACGDDGTTPTDSGTATDSGTTGDTGTAGDTGTTGDTGTGADGEHTLIVTVE
ncbi:MAG: hypothetical protein DRJ42_30990 [Deltaproteobacteria bacterium]|nr:MAG: hypothetical protein DRJ42_30990 [Deltaproteobacteria bacterium]